MIVTYGIVIDNETCLPVYIGNEAYKIYTYNSNKELKYLTKNGDIFEVDSIGHLIQAMKLMLDSFKSGKYKKED